MPRSLRKYWRIGISTWQEYLTYRLNFALEVIGGVTFTLVTLWLWIRIAGPAGVGSYSTNQLVTYLIGAGIITSYYFLTGQGDDVNDDIARGTLSSTLTRPINPLLVWFVRDQTRKLLTLSIGLIGFLIVALVYRHALVPPASLNAFVSMVVVVIIAGIIHFLLYTLFSLFAFWLDQTWGERFFLRVIAELASGILIPLSLFPPLLQKIALLLPFRFFAFVPMDIYLGRITGSDLALEYLALAGWTIGLFILVQVVMRRGLQSYAGEGI